MMNFLKGNNMTDMDKFKKMEEHFPYGVKKMENERSLSKTILKNRKDLLPKIRSQLDKNKASSFLICKNILQKRIKDRVLTVVSNNKEFNEKECGPHVVPVTGYRCQKGKLEYLIQNSWGTSCSNYTKSLRKSNNCKDGKVWVPEKLLLKGLIRTTTTP